MVLCTDYELGQHLLWRQSDPHLYHHLRKESPKVGWNSDRWVPAADRYSLRSHPPSPDNGLHWDCPLAGQRADSYCYLDHRYIHRHPPPLTYNVERRLREYQGHKVHSNPWHPHNPGRCRSGGKLQAGYLSPEQMPPQEFEAECLLLQAQPRRAKDL